VLLKRLDLLHRFSDGYVSRPTLELVA